MKEIHDIIKKRIRNMLKGKEFSGGTVFPTNSTIIRWKVDEVDFSTSVLIVTDYWCPMWWDRKIKMAIKDYYNLDAFIISRTNKYCSLIDLKLDYICINEI